MDAVPRFKVVVLTGAGISAESGIRTFRDDGGLWEGHRVEDVATKLAFGANPGRVNVFYNQRRRQLSEIAPNLAHRALVDLEDCFGDRFLLITQNIDDLHERAGSRRVVHMHGELLKKRCVWCGVVSPCLQDQDLSSTDICDRCGREMGMRPDVVWFGETPYDLDRIQEALESTSVFLVIGTSGIVEPAARFSVKAKVYGATTIEVNLAETSKSSGFDEVILGKATEVIPALVGRLMAAG